jgi:hypothetical protein
MSLEWYFYLAHNGQRRTNNVGWPFLHPGSRQQTSRRVAKKLSLELAAVAAGAGQLTESMLQLYCYCEDFKGPMEGQSCYICRAYRQDPDGLRPQECDVSGNLELTVDGFHNFMKVIESCAELGPQCLSTSEIRNSLIRHLRTFIGTASGQGSA